jgi:hypothetical protein
MSYMGKRLRVLDASQLQHLQSATLEGSLPAADIPIVFDEVPVGAINGINDTFTLAHTPVSGVELKLDGVDLVPVVHYTLSGNTVTFVSTFIPQTGENLTASYEY